MIAVIDSGAMPETEAQAMLAKIIGANIRRLRGDMTKAELARRVAGLTDSSYVGKVERGRRGLLRLETLIALREEFGCTLAELVGEPQHSLSAEELRTIRNLSTLTNSDRRHIIEFVDFLARAINRGAPLTQTDEKRRSPNSSGGKGGGSLTE